MNNNIQNLLADAHQMRAAGQFQEALAKCFEASSVDSGNPEIFRLMGLIYRDLEQPQEAVKIFEFLSEHFPENGELVAELALSLYATEDKQKAYETAKKAVELEEKSEFCLDILGRISNGTNSWPTAAGAYKRLAEMHPDNPVAYRFWSNALNESLQFIEAAEVYENVIRIDGMTIEHAYNMARFYFSGRVFEKAQPFYEKTIKMDPENVGPYLGLARVHIQFGDLEKGEELVRKALELQPDYVYAFTLLNDLRPEENNQEAANILEAKVVKDQWEGPLDKAHTHLFLGKYYHKEKQFDRAFKNFKTYNDERAAIYDNDKIYYDRAVMEENFAESKRIFSKEGLKKLEGCGSDSEVPIFIVAMPRSGTTLLEQIIATHSDVYGAGEMTTMTRIFTELNFKINEEPGRDIYEIIRENAKEWAALYLDSLNAPAGVKHVTDKMPVNFIYCGLIQAIFPKARIINIKRNPLDICLSIFSNSFSESYAYSARMEDLGHYYNLYDGLMDHWKETLSMKYLELSYEDLVDNQEARSRDILAFCGLDWQEQVMEFYKGQKAAYTISQVQVSKPINRRGVERWKPYEKNIQPLIGALDANVLAQAGIKK